MIYVLCMIQNDKFGEKYYLMNLGSYVFVYKYAALQLRSCLPNTQEYFIHINVISIRHKDYKILLFPHVW